MRRLLIAALSASVPLSGCVETQTHAPVAAPAGEAAPTASLQPPPEAATASPVAADTAERPTAAEAPAPAPPPTPPPSPSPSLSPSPTKTVPVAPSTVLSPPKAAALAPEKLATPAPAPVAAAAPVEPPTSPELDLAGLEQRLRETPAIGVFTKLSLKNQVDDLLDQFRGFYRGEIKVPLADLRQRYELLLLKVLTLLQDADRPLADSIASSREAIWGILADPQKFATM
jgi:hypothetical protein